MRVAGNWLLRVFLVPAQTCYSVFDGKKQAGASERSYAHPLTGLTHNSTTQLKPFVFHQPRYGCYQRRLMARERPAVYKTTFLPNAIVLTLSR